MHPTAQSAIPTGTAARFAHGFRLAARGLGMWARRPKLMLLGAIPALITALLFLGGFIALFVNLDDLSAWSTGWADGMSAGWRTTLRWIAGLAILAAAGLIAMLTYTAVTMIIGDPFYEAISGDVEELCGGVRGEVEIGFWRGLGKSVVEAVRLLVRTMLVAILLFAAGFIPLVGQSVIPVLGILVAAWFFTVSIAAVPFTRRGVDYPVRRKRLAEYRSVSVGFGTGFILLFLIPGGAVLATPAAVAGGTLLARELFGEPATPSGRGPSAAPRGGARPFGGDPGSVPGTGPGAVPPGGTGYPSVPEGPSSVYPPIPEGPSSVYPPRKRA